MNREEFSNEINRIDESNKTSIDKLMEFINPLWDLQVEDEQLEYRTKHDNNVGFNKSDAKFFTDLHDRFCQGKRIWAYEVMMAKRKLKKYWRQFE